MEGLPMENNTFFNLKEAVMINNTDGIVLLGCGGDKNEWIHGITDILQKEKIVPTGKINEIWGEIVLLETTGGRNDIALTFKDGVNYNMGKFAMWRLGFGDCSWISDYVENYEDQFITF